jgi:Flp pilus assembly protein protease CpaA
LFPVLPLLFAAAVDLRIRQIPDSCSVSILAAGVLAAVFGWAGIRWWMVLSGVGVGLLLGLVLFRGAKLGGGDVKLVISLGGLLGPAGIVLFVFWMAVAGGVLALLALKRGRRDYAYGPAILFGYVAWLFWPGGLAEW